AAGPEAERDAPGEPGAAATRGHRLPRDGERPADRVRAPGRGQRPAGLRQPRPEGRAGGCRGGAGVAWATARVRRLRAARRRELPLADRPQLRPARPGEGTCATCGDEVTVSSAF